MPNPDNPDSPAQRPEHERLAALLNTNKESQEEKDREFNKEFSKNLAVPITPKTASVVVTPKIVDPRATELLSKLEATLIEYDGESNVPLTHDYWNWVNEYRALLNTPPPDVEIVPLGKSPYAELRPDEPKLGESKLKK